MQTAVGLENERKPYGKLVSKFAANLKTIGRYEAKQ